MATTQARNEKASIATDPISRLAGAFTRGAAIAAGVRLKNQGFKRDLTGPEVVRMAELLAAASHAALPKLLEDAKVLHLGGYSGWMETAFQCAAAGAGIEAANTFLKEVA